MKRNPPMASRRPTPSEPVQAVRISSRHQSAPQIHDDPEPLHLARPTRWLGARSPFGLALPDAHPSPITMYAPRGVWMDDERLIVCDSGNHRILIWRELPRTDQAPADVVLGQPDFTSEGPAAGGRGPQNGLHLPTGVIVVEGRLVVADAWHHRLLVWNEIPTRSDVPPDHAIGQPDLAQVEVNRAGSPDRDTLYWPYGLAWIGGRLHVADTGNRRVLIWDGFPESDRPADYLLGQARPDAGQENRDGPIAADSFRWPHDFAGHGEWLFVADAGNHRVLGWKGFPESDRPADVVLGQEDFSTAWELPYDAQGPRRLRFPYAIDCCDNVLAAADTANNRILFWRLPLDAPRFAPAFDLIGQASFAENGENRWQNVRDETLCWPYGTCLHDGQLVIADSGNNRVTIWDCHDVMKLSHPQHCKTEVQPN